MAQDILCLPDSTNAPFDSIELKKIKNNKYSAIVKMNSETLLSDEVSYVFLRRNQYGRFRNKQQTVVIKTKKLYVNQAQKSSLKVSTLDSTSFLGLCKLY